MRNRCYYIYILASRRGALYIGFTGNLALRIEQHRAGLVGGHSARYRTDRLVYVEVAEDPESGITREKQLKSWRREKKVQLIESANPYWEDLAAQVV